MSRFMGQSGKQYIVQKIIQETNVSGGPFRVQLAVAGDERFILKDIHKPHYDEAKELHQRVRGLNHVRHLHDTIPGQPIFVYKYLTHTLHDIAKQDLPLPTTKRILKEVLVGLSGLHERDIVHTDIKAENILLNLIKDETTTRVVDVQISDIDNAYHVPIGKSLRGLQLGAYSYRSPEAHLRARIDKYSDMFSFGNICIHAIHNMHLFPHPSSISTPETQILTTIQQQISHFATAKSLNGFLTHIGPVNPWREAVSDLRYKFSDESPRLPFRCFRGVEYESKQLICGLMDFDPKARLTAEEALRCTWFRGAR